MALRIVLCACVLATAGCTDLRVDLRHAKELGLNSLFENVPALPQRATRFDDTILHVAMPPAVDAFGYPGNTNDRREVLGMLRERRYDALERFLRLQESKVARDIRYEYHLRDAYHAFRQSAPWMESALDAWVAANPRSHRARLARADYYVNQAWEKRGEKWARRTSDEQFAGMWHFADRATEEVAAADAIQPGHLVGYSILLELTRFGGETTEALRLAKEGLRHHPGSFVLRTYTIQALEPRWGGSLTAIRAFAREGAAEASRNPRLAALPGFVEAARADDYMSDRRYDAAVHHFTRALESGPHWHFYLGRGEAYYRAGDYVRALDDLTRALQQRPQWPATLEYRGKALARMAPAAPPAIRDTLLDHALRDLELLQSVTTPDSAVQHMIDWARKAKAD
jgi:tetratricopeptide (TPR) repeat protein